MVSRYSNSVRILGVVLVGATLFFSGCGKYTRRPFGTCQGPQQEKQNVSVSAARVLPEDAKYYFSRNIAKKGYHAVQLSVYNKSDKAYVLHGEDIDFQIEPATQVAKDLHLDTTKRVATWGLTGFLLTPLFFVPAVVDGLNSRNANKELDRDFTRRVISNDSRIIIEPRTLMNRVFFVALENTGKSNCALKLAQKEDGTKNLTFDVPLM